MSIKTPYVEPKHETIRLFDQDAVSEASASTQADQQDPLLDDVDSDEDIPESERAHENETEMDCRLRMNREFLNEQLSSPFPWTVQLPRKCKTIFGVEMYLNLVKSPTISHIPHNALTPYLYRNIKNAGSFEDLARLLETRSDWEERFADAVRSSDVSVAFRVLLNSSDNLSEADLQVAIADVVKAVAKTLGLHLRESRERSVVIGGLLAEHKYDIRGAMDPIFSDMEGVPLLSTEVKTKQAFQTHELWYRKSRGVQVLSSLYASNSPTFLVTQACWKLFVENDDRTEILTFPYVKKKGESLHRHSTRVMTMGTDFLKTIVICLLSQRKRRLPQVRIKGSTTCLHLSRGRVAETKKSPPETPLKGDEPQKKKLRSSSGRVGKKHKRPTHISGYLPDGTPIISSVKLFSQETIELIEEELRQEDEERWRQEQEERLRLEQEKRWQLEQEERGADKLLIEPTLKIKTSASEETLAEE